ncbi:MAG: hypothetical protein ABID67_02370 [Candidatus Nealsonbacteria bacterium]
MTIKGQKIIVLRKKGKTYGEIEKILKLPKSTVAWWLKNVKIPKSLQEQIFERSRKKWRKNITIYNKFHGKIRSQEAAKKREKYKKEASKEIGALSKKDLKLIGSALYWAESGTKNKNSLRFGNSNPLMIKAILKFFREICNIPDDKIGARVHIYPGINYCKIRNFWSQVTKLSKKNFYPPQTQISKASKGKRAKTHYPTALSI